MCEGGRNGRLIPGLSRESHSLPSRMIFLRAGFELVTPRGKPFASGRAPLSGAPLPCGCALPCRRPSWTHRCSSSTYFFRLPEHSTVIATGECWPLADTAEYKWREGFKPPSVIARTLRSKGLHHCKPFSMADHKRFSLATDIKVYFCDPRSPWQRGSNENANGLLRQYLLKGIDLSGYSQSKLNAIARRLNERPRKTLNYETPAQRFQQSVASTG
jgi:transposase InsO family protein